MCGRSESSHSGTSESRALATARSARVDRSRSTQPSVMRSMAREDTPVRIASTTSNGRTNRAATDILLNHNHSTLHAKPLELRFRQCVSRTSLS